VTPELQLRTLYVLDDRGRLVALREPGARTPPALALVLGLDGCAWAVRCDMSDDIAARLSRLASEEPPPADLRDEPVNAQRYLSVVDGRVEAGPAFAFPDEIDEPGGVVEITDPAVTMRHFPGLDSELEGRAPALAILEDGQAVSVCACARRSGEAAEASLFTAKAYRGRGYGPRVTAAWARAVRASGRIPLYSTSWKNAASREVARKLGLVQYATDWSLYD
jgi:RimJ/RimL family protein N-acetyltransferase